MNKKIIIVFISLLFSKNTFAESYYFNGCKLSNVVEGNYIVNVDKKLIEVTLKGADGTVQNFSDKIKSIEKNKIVSEKIKSQKGKNIFFQYFLDSEKKTVLKLQYTKQGEDDMQIFKLTESRKTFCKDVKGDWDKVKIDKAEIDKEQEEILKAQKKLKEEQSKIVECQNDDYRQWTNCKGSFKAETGHIYDGIFKNGDMPNGISMYPGGAKYVGEFKNYKPHGYGTFIWKNKDKYVGEWKEGKSHGNGTKIWKDGRKYFGTFENDKMEGKGSMFYPNGNKYVGEFVNNKRHGEGTYYYSDGTAFIGNFIAGKQEGLGECVAKDGSSLPCKSQTDTQAENFSGKDTKNISIVAKKWIRISQYESNTKKGKKIMDKLKTDFETEASQICSETGKYTVLKKKIEILDLDETPAYGLETKLQIGINGVVECG